MTLASRLKRLIALEQWQQVANIGKEWQALQRRICGEEIVVMAKRYGVEPPVDPENPTADEWERTAVPFFVEQRASILELSRQYNIDRN